MTKKAIYQLLWLLYWSTYIYINTEILKQHTIKTSRFKISCCTIVKQRSATWTSKSWCICTKSLHFSTSMWFFFLPLWPEQLYLTGELGTSKHKLVKNISHQLSTQRFSNCQLFSQEHMQCLSHVRGACALQMHSGWADASSDGKQANVSLGKKHDEVFRPFFCRQHQLVNYC